MKKKGRILFSGIVLSVFLIIADQLTKYLAWLYLRGTTGIQLIPGVFQLYYLENRGAAFGMLRNRQWIFILIAFFMMAAMIYVFIRLPDEVHYRMLRIVCILVTAGAAGNLIDRLVHHYVIDFLYFSLIDFPVFNLADCYVCIGAAAAFFLFLTIYKDDSFDFLNPKKGRH